MNPIKKDGKLTEEEVMYVAKKGFKYYVTLMPIIKRIVAAIKAKRDARKRK